VRCGGRIEEPGGGRRYCRECARARALYSHRKWKASKGDLKPDRLGKRLRRNAALVEGMLTVQELGALLSEAEFLDRRYGWMDKYGLAEPEQPIHCLSCSSIVGEHHEGEIVLFGREVTSYPDGYLCGDCERQAMVRRQERALMTAL
jgi:hypothetical protein